METSLGCKFAINFSDESPSICSFVLDEAGLYAGIIILDKKYPIIPPTPSFYVEGDSVRLYPLSAFDRVNSLEGSDSSKGLVACLKQYFKNKDGYFFSALIQEDTRSSEATSKVAEQEYITFFIKDKNNALTVYDTGTWTCNKATNQIQENN